MVVPRWHRKYNDWQVCFKGIKKKKKTMQEYEKHRQNALETGILLLHIGYHFDHELLQLPEVDLGKTGYVEA